MCRKFRFFFNFFQVGASITQSLLAESAVLSTELGQQLASVSGLVPALWVYLHALQLDMGMPDAMTVENGIAGPDMSEALCGRAGAAVVSAVVGQMARVRLELCRDLLLIQQVSLQLGQQCRLSPESAGQLRSTLIPKTALLTQAYFALLHISTAVPMEPSPATLEAGRRQLAALSLSDGPVTSTTVPGPGRPATVLELFFLGSGGDRARALVTPALEGTSPR